jgi:hypothetical protein
MEKGSVYLLRSGRAYKIGRTGNLSQRLRYIDQALPNPVEVIYYLETGESSSLERFLHRQFAPYRIRGDWYRLRQEHIAEIQSIIEWPPINGIPSVPIHDLQKDAKPFGPRVRVKCRQCAYPWVPYHGNPLRCPSCRSTRWNQPLAERRPGRPRKRHPDA